MTDAALVKTDEPSSVAVGGMPTNRRLTRRPRKHGDGAARGNEDRASDWVVAAQPWCDFGRSDHCNGMAATYIKGGADGPAQARYDVRWNAATRRVLYLSGLIDSRDWS